MAMVTLELTDAEEGLLRAAVVRGIWTDSTQYDAEWIEDVIEEGESGVWLAAAVTPMMSRILRKIVEAVK
jgi:hypothetical protein